MGPGTNRISYIMGHYEKLAKVYFLADLFLGPLRKEIIHLVGVRKEKILDVACGTGSLARALCGAGHTVFGLDLSGSMLGRTKAHNRPPGHLNYIQADAAQIPFMDSVFDIAVTSLALHEMPADVAVAALKEMERVTKKDGLIIAADLSPHGTILRRIFSLVLFAVEPKYYRVYLRCGLEDYIAQSGLAVVSKTSLFLGLVTVMTCRQKG